MYSMCPKRPVPVKEVDLLDILVSSRWNRCVALTSLV